MFSFAIKTKDEGKMCGIVGYIGAKREAYPILIKGLKRLEYRGYDSAGVALIDDNGNLNVYKTKGKVADLEEYCADKNVTGNIGIAHTRWATHGEPSSVNAHPHYSQSKNLAIIHNGIIENYAEIKHNLIEKGIQFQSETDTEVLVQLIDYIQEKKAISLLEAVQLALHQVIGAYAIAILDKRNPDTIIAARKQSPLVVGIGDGEFFLGSDASPIIEYTDKVVCLDEGNIAVMKLGEELKVVNIETFCRIPVEVEYASEFRYRNPVVNENDVVIAISQSGETADTLAAVELAKAKGAFIYGICNAIGSSIPRATDTGTYIHVGPEIGVASTKAFTGQVTVLTMFALALANAKGTIKHEEYVQTVKELAEIPNMIKEVLKVNDQIADMARTFTYARNFLYLGRGFSYPVALEGALKLKEISYIHAEGYPAAEMKHGPIALIDSDMPVVAIATQNGMYEKVRSNIQEIKARQGRVIALVTKGDTTISHIADAVIELPETMECLEPLVATIPLQLLAYHIAVCKGKDVDQPRNLAKSVTVE